MVDLAGLDGGIGRSPIACNCISQQTIWRHIRNLNMCLVTSSMADFQRVATSGQYIQTTHIHVKFDEDGHGDDLLLSPSYIPTERTRVEGAEQDGGGPARGSPITTTAMQVTTRVYFA